MNWETIDKHIRGTANWEETKRAKVPGGWVLRVQGCHDLEYVSNLCFIPDPLHEWEVEDD